MNIIWQKPDSGIAVTAIIDGSDPVKYAETLKERGDVPSDWIAVFTNYKDGFPEEKQEYWMWNGCKIIVDNSLLK